MKTIVKKIKDWLTNRPQFEIIQTVVNGKIIQVKRLKDGQIFAVGKPYLLDAPADDGIDVRFFYITDFNEDLVHLKYSVVRSFTEVKNQQAKECEIDQLRYVVSGPLELIKL